MICEKLIAVVIDVALTGLVGVHPANALPLGGQQADYPGALVCLLYYFVFTSSCRGSPWQSR